MLFKQEILDRIRTGEITLAFRRWRRPTVKSGGRLRTAIGELAIERVSKIEADAISDSEARRAGFPDRATLLAELARREGEVYRIELRFAGADRRIALRKNDRIGEAELARIAGRLAKMDSGRQGKWVLGVLRLIEKHPARRASDLAAMCGMDTPGFKRRVRQLKELGLTESLETGYRLSPRGVRVLKGSGR